VGDQGPAPEHHPSRRALPSTYQASSLFPASGQHKTCARGRHHLAPEFSSPAGQNFAAGRRCQSRCSRPGIAAAAAMSGSRVLRLLSRKMVRGPVANLDRSAGAAYRLTPGRARHRRPPGHYARSPATPRAQRRDYQGRAGLKPICGAFSQAPGRRRASTFCRMRRISSALPRDQRGPRSYVASSSSARQASACLPCRPARHYSTPARAREACAPRRNRSPPHAGRTRDAGLAPQRQLRDETFARLVSIITARHRSASAAATSTPATSPEHAAKFSRL